MINVEENLREICRRKGLRLSDVAERVGSGQSNLINSIKGNPKLSTLQDIANALQVSISELLTMRPEKATGVAVIDGQVYQVSKPAADVVQLPVYERYSELRNAIREFVPRVVEFGENAALMGMLETYEVFCITYDSRNEFFNLSLCYSNGKTTVILYDKLEYCQWREDDTEETVQWDYDALIKDLIVDAEETVITQLQKK